MGHVDSVQSILILALQLLIWTLGVFCSAVVEIDDGLHFVVEPQDVFVPKNSPVTFNCSATTLPKFAPVRFSWHHNGVVVNDDRRVVLPNGSLYIKRVTHRKKRGLSDSGDYVCIAQDRFGKIMSRSAKLHVASLSRVTSDSHPVTVETGGVLRLVCNVTGTPDPMILWEINRSYLPPTKTKTEGQKYVQLISGVLQITNITTKDRGSYKCKAFNIANNRSREMFVNVTGNNQNLRLRPPSIVAGPQNVTVMAGTSVTLECLVSGYPTPRISWRRKDGEDVRSDAWIIGQGNLHLPTVTHGDAATYICYAQVDGQSTVVKAAGSLNVISPPVIRSKPTSVSQVTAGTVRFVCQIEKGVPTPIVEWFKDNLPVHINGRIKLTTDTVLVISQLDQKDSGYYQCVVRNIAGETKATARLEVKKVDQAPEAPQNLIAITRSSTSIELRWDRPRFRINELVPIIAFSVHYYQSQGKSVEDQQVVQASPHVMENLSPYTNYTFYVVAYTPSGASERSKAVEQQTGEALPIGGPAVTLNAVSPTSIKVTWGELHPDKALGIIAGYKVIYRLHNQPSQMVANCHANDRQYVIRNLDPGKRYDVRVLAGNKVGFPDLSEKDLPWATEATPSQLTPEAPQPPEMQLVAISSTRVMVSWTPGKGRIIGFKLYHSVSGGTEVGPIILTNNSYRHQVDNLPPGTWCEIGILAFNQFGESQRVVKTVQTKAPPGNGTNPDHPSSNLLPPPAPVKVKGEPLSNNKILLQWEMLPHPSPITNYTILFYAVTPSGEKEEHYMESATTRCMFTYLKSYTNYEFAVCAHSEGIPGPFSQRIQVRTKEGTPSKPEDVSGEVVKPGIVRLDWSPPKETNGVIVSYIIMYNMDKDQSEVYWVKKQQNGSSTSVLLEDLEIDKAYYFKLQAATRAGKGPTTSVFVINTCEGIICRPPVTGGNVINTSVAPTTEAPSGTSDQMMGIIIGVSIGVACIITCIIIVILWHRCCSPAPRSPSSPDHYESNRQLPPIDGQIPDSSPPSYHELESYTPMLDLLPENSTLDTKGGVAVSAVLLERRLEDRAAPTANGLDDNPQVHLLANPVYVEGDSQGQDHESTSSQLQSSGNLSVSGISPQGDVDLERQGRQETCDNYNQSVSSSTADRNTTAVGATTSNGTPSSSKSSMNSMHSRTGQTHDRSHDQTQSGTPQKTDAMRTQGERNSIAGAPSPSVTTQGVSKSNSYDSQVKSGQDGSVRPPDANVQC